MDTATSSAARYSRGAVVLHWLIAALIVVNFVVAWVHESLPKDERVVWMGNHKAIGITVLLLTVVRIGWRLTHTPPPLVETLKAWEVALTRVVHSLFYLVMLALPLSGWAMHSAASQGKPVGWFSLFDIPALPVAYDKPTIGMFHEGHEVFATLMLALLAIHVVAAFKHLHVDKDGTMRRMIPWLP